jgi:hypothetical protein
MPAVRLVECAQGKVLLPPGAGRVDIAGVCNARHVGALPAGNGPRLEPRVLLRSADLQTVAEEGYAKIVNLGIASVVDFRANPEERLAPDAPRVIRGTRHLNLEVPRIEQASSQAYVTTLQALEPKLARLFAHLGAPDALPALFHCQTG